MRGRRLGDFQCESSCAFQIGAVILRQNPSGEVADHYPTSRAPRGCTTASCLCVACAPARPTWVGVKLAFSLFPQFLLPPALEKLEWLQCFYLVWHGFFVFVFWRRASSVQLGPLRHFIVLRRVRLRLCNVMEVLVLVSDHCYGLRLGSLLLRGRLSGTSNLA